MSGARGLPWNLLYSPACIALMTLSLIPQRLSTGGPVAPEQAGSPSLYWILALSPRLKAAALTLTVHLWGTVWEWVLFAGVSRHTLPVHMWPGEIVQPGREVQPSVPFCSYSGRPGHCRVVRRIPVHHSVSPGLEPLLSHKWWCLV